MIKDIQFVTYALITIGAINLGLVGLFDVDLVHVIFGANYHVLYAIIGIAATINLFLEMIICSSISDCCCIRNN